MRVAGSADVPPAVRATARIDHERPAMLRMRESQLARFRELGGRDVRAPSLGRLSVRQAKAILTIRY